jgi:hypothetical protein
MPDLSDRHCGHYYIIADSDYVVYTVVTKQTKWPMSKVWWCKFVFLYPLRHASDHVVVSAFFLDRHEARLCDRSLECLTVALDVI